MILITAGRCCQWQRDMHPGTTNISAKAFDDCLIGFESVGPFALDNEFSRIAMPPAHSIAFAERRHARLGSTVCYFGRYVAKAQYAQPFSAYAGIDWGDTKHDVCVQAASDDQREFDCIAHQE